MFSETVPSTINKCKGAGVGRVNCHGQKLIPIKTKIESHFNPRLLLKIIIG